MSSTTSRPKFGTIAIILDGEDWVETLSDEREVEVLEGAFEGNILSPLDQVYRFRARQEVEDEIFGDHIENLLTNSNVRSEVREHGVKWLESRMRIEKYKKEESDAAKIIATFALQKLELNPTIEDFQIVAEEVQVRVRIFKIDALK